MHSETPQIPHALVEITAAVQIPLLETHAAIRPHHTHDRARIVASFQAKGRIVDLLRQPLHHLEEATRMVPKMLDRQLHAQHPQLPPQRVACDKNAEDRGQTSAHAQPIGDSHKLENRDKLTSHAYARKGHLPSLAVGTSQPSGPDSQTRDGCNAKD